MDISQADLDTLGAVVHQRNRFVCIQLHTVAKEQHANMQQASAEH